MTRNREKKALYEVMSKGSWPKSSCEKPLESPHPGEPSKVERTKIKFSTPFHRRAAQWLNQPRIVQFNAGRLEISIPYQLAIALLLGLILLLLVAYRLGQSSQRISGSTVKMPESTQITAPEVIAEAPQIALPAEEELPVDQEVETVESKGDNRIVIQTYQLRADLEPVRRYFAQFGIETEIIKISNWYYLVTKDKYENPAKPWTDGYIARQKIVELGTKYRAPMGYESFGSKPFSDAYGMRFDE